MNPFATIPIEDRYAEFHQRYPALNLIGNTRMVEILCFKEELPEVKVYAKAEYANPGGSLKDRPVRRMLLYLWPAHSRPNGSRRMPNRH